MREDMQTRFVEAATAVAAMLAAMPHSANVGRGGEVVLRWFMRDGRFCVEPVITSIAIRVE